MSENKGERIAKVLARAGLCSRREAERWITAGRVSVNGKVLESPAITVSASDQVVVDGKPVGDAEPTRLWRYHKPPGLMTTNMDPEGRATVFERLPKDMPRVLSVGRLDLNSEGLLLLTNDGELSRRLELPEMGWTRKYRVRVHGHVDEDKLARLKKGITIDGMRYASIEAHLEQTTGHNSWVAVTLREGKNREIRRVMEALGLSVNRLIRTAYGPFQLGNLVRGGVAEMPPKVLRENLQIKSERPGYRKPRA